MPEAAIQSRAARELVLKFASAAGLARGEAVARTTMVTKEAIERCILGIRAKVIGCVIPAEEMF